MSALATIVGSLGELSESELRQLYLVIGVRLGNPDVPTGAKPRKAGGGKATNTKPKAGKTGTSAPSSKGNPKRKSQWANHPLYIEYSRLKKAVESQAKEAKTSFNAVDTAESSAYRIAFTRWVEAKASFRGHGESDQAVQVPAGGEPVASGPSKQPMAAERAEDEEESSEEEEAAEAAPPRVEQAKPAPPPPTPKGAGKSSPSPSKGKAPRK